MEEHKRRAHYKGKYPRSFNEKYKEFNPDKYQDTIERIIQKGNTPAGTHIPIMVNEILDILKIKEGEIGLDATFGYGGHSLKMLEKLNHTGHLYCLDIDSIEIEKTKERITSLGYTDQDFSAHNINFRNLDQVVENKKCDFLLADLGVSSMQVDDPARGFSFKQDGPLDLRLNQLIGVPASDVLMGLKKYEIENILVENSDEPFAEQIAAKICQYKSYGLIDTTTKLYNIIKDALNFLPAKEREVNAKKSAQRVFQALRIEVNSEFEALTEFLTKLPTVMNSDGRVAILTFHSGEDRLVKKMFKEYYLNGTFKEISDEVIRPSREECYNNPRATSTKLRWAIKK